jgi:hypothetical protein
MEPIVIKYNTNKLVWYTFLALFFVVGGYFMFGKESSRYSKEVTYVASVICVIFGTIGAGVFIKRLVAKDKTALILDSKGITDKSSGVSLGFIPWEDVTGIKLTEVRSGRFAKNYFITVMVKNPEEYIAKSKNVAARYSLQWSTDRYGSPINITPNATDIKHTELKKMVKDAFERYKTTKP